MPAKSAKQLKLMQAVANNPKFAKKVNIPQSVGKEYSKESKMYNKKMMNGGKVKKMMKGGKVKKMMGGGMAMADKAGARAMDPRMAMAMEAQRRQAAMGGMKKGGGVKKMKAGGNTSRENRTEELGRVDAERADTTSGRRDLRDEKSRIRRELKMKAGGSINDKMGRALARTGGSNAPMKAKGTTMKKGGKVKGKSKSSASTRADGIAQRGRTRGRMV